MGISLFWPGYMFTQSNLACATTVGGIPCSVVVVVVIEMETSVLVTVAVDVVVDHAVWTEVTRQDAAHAWEKLRSVFGICNHFT